MAASLPTEIWIQICETLCICCQMPKHANGIPDFRISQAREGKAALRALCLVSRDFKDISQGILFHYFLNSSKGGDQDDIDRNIHDRTPSFLRALVSNPLLGSQIRMIGLFEPMFQTFDDITRQDLEAWSRLSSKYHIQVPSQITGALGDESPMLGFDEPGPSAQLVMPDATGDYAYWAVGIVARKIYKWLHALTLNLVPQVTHLQLTSSLRSLVDSQNPQPAFSRLRELTYENEITIEDVVDSHVLCPNLSSLDAREFLSLPKQPINGHSPAINLRKLSVACDPESLSAILRLCLQLEDLECHVCPEDLAGENALEWPTHTKSTLRRLAWTSDDAGDKLEDNDPENACIVPLRDFEQLEILEIDQWSLMVYSMLLRTKTPSVLPKTLRILHIAFAREALSQKAIALQLRKLAFAKSRTLPHLAIVQVDDPPRRSSRKKTLAKFVEVTGVTRVMSDAGIDLRIGQEAPDSDDYIRSILSPVPGAGSRTREEVYQNHVFSLDNS